MSKCEHGKIEDELIEQLCVDLKEYDVRVREVNREKECPNCGKILSLTFFLRRHVGTRIIDWQTYDSF